MVFGWILIALAIFVVLVTLLAASGKIAPNGLLGIRTPATQLNELTWRRAHHAAAWLLIPGCAAGAIVGLLLIIGNTSDTTGELALLGLLVLLAISAFVADRAARKVRTP